MDYTDVLRRLGINDAQVVHEREDGSAVEATALDEKTVALVRVAALAAVGGAVPSFGAEVDLALDAGATPTEIVEVLVVVVPIVGLPCVVAAAPKLALALGYDLTEALEYQSLE